MLIIPAIDLKDGKCVRLRQGRAEEMTVFGDDPVAMGLRWQAAGAQLAPRGGPGRRLSSGSPKTLSPSGRLRQALSIPMELGGGIRTLDTIRGLYRPGHRPPHPGHRGPQGPGPGGPGLRRFPGRIAFGLDAKDGLLAVEGWTETSRQTALEVAQALAPLKARGLHLHRHRPGRGQTGRQSRRPPRPWPRP